MDGKRYANELSKEGFKQAIFKAYFPTPLPSKYIDEFYGRDMEKSIPASFVREKDGWYIYLDRFQNLPQDDIISIVNFISKEYERYFPDLDPKSLLRSENKFIKRGISSMANEFFNEVWSIPSTVIFPLSFISFQHMTFCVLYHSNYGELMTKAVMKLFEKSPYPIEFSVEDVRAEDPLSYGTFLKWNNQDLSNFKILVSKMKLGGNEQAEPDIFKNNAIFLIKSLSHSHDSELSEIIFIVKSLDGYLRGNYSKIIPINESSKIFQVHFTSSWTSDVLGSVIFPIGSGNLHWGYSLNNEVYNYFIIEGKNVSTLLRGFRKHWVDIHKSQKYGSIVYLDYLNKYLS